MGTPVPSKIREHEYSDKVTEPKVVKRQLTEEERMYYDSLGKPGKRIVAYNYQDATLFSQDKESEEMTNPKTKIPVPDKEWILEQCAKYPGKTKAVNAIATATGASMPVVFSWFKDLKIEYDFSANKVEPKPTPDENMKAAEQESGNGTPEEDTREFDEVVNTDLIPEKPEDFVLTGKIYRFGDYTIDIQYDNKEVIIIDNANLVELSLPFKKIKRFAGNLFGIGVELMQEGDM